MVANEKFNVGDLSVAAQVARIKAAGAQVMIAWVNGAPAATVLRTVIDSGLDIPIIFSTANATYVAMHQFAAFVPPAGLFFPTIPAMVPSVITDRGTRAAVDAFRTTLIAHNIRPTFASATAWDPALLVVGAFRKLGPGATAQQVYGYLKGLSGWAGINGPYDFRSHPARGLGPGQAVVVRWEKDRDDFVPVSAIGGAPLKR